MATTFRTPTSRPVTGTSEDVDRVGPGLVDNAGKYRIWAEVYTAAGTGWIPFGLLLDQRGNPVPLETLPDPISFADLERTYGILEGPEVMP